MISVIKETEVYGIDAQVLNAGCSQYRTTYIIPEIEREGKKVLDIEGFPIEVLDINGVAVSSLIENGSLIRVNGGFRISMNFRELRK